MVQRLLRPGQVWKDNSGRIRAIWKVTRNKVYFTHRDTLSTDGAHWPIHLYLSRRSHLRSQLIGYLPVVTKPTKMKRPTVMQLLEKHQMLDEAELAWSQK